MCTLKYRGCQPMILDGLLGYFTPSGPNYGDSGLAYIYASGLILSTLVRVLLYHSIAFEVFHCGMKMRVACCSAIFHQVL